MLLVALLLASAVAGGLPSSASAAAPTTSAATGPAPYPTEPFVAARSSREFGDSVGVNVHLTWLDTAYGDFDTLLARMRELGVRYIRDGLCSTCPYDIDRLNRLSAAGIKAHLISGTLEGGSAELNTNLDTIRDRIRNAVVSVGAPNEPDYTGDPNWIDKTRALQRELWQRVKGTPSLQDIKVLGPAVVGHSERAALGDLSGYLDYGNMHPYPGGGTPLHNLADEQQLAVPISANKPLVATEAGYHSDLQTTGGHPPTSERASGYYMPRLALEGFRGGVKRTFVYQLADPFAPSVAQSRGLSVMENTFGLLRSDLSPKPSFLGLRNLLRATDGGSQPVAAPGGLRYGLENAGADVHQLLLRSADGSYALVLWREVSVWDRVARTDLYPDADRFDVVLGQPMSLARRFDPVVSDTERARWVDPRRIPVDVAGGPVVLRLTPPCQILSGATTAAPTSAAKSAVAAPTSAATPTSKGALPTTTTQPVKLRLAGTKRGPRLRRSFTVKVACAAPCATVKAGGKLALKRSGRKRRFRLKGHVGRVKHGVVTLRLRIPARARRAARRALGRGGRATAHLTIVARTATGAALETTSKRVVFTRR